MVGLGVVCCGVGGEAPTGAWEKWMARGMACGCKSWEKWRLGKGVWLQGLGKVGS